MPRTGVDQNLNLSNPDDTIISYEDGPDSDQENAPKIDPKEDPGTGLKEDQEEALLPPDDDPEPHQDVTEMKHVSGGLEAFLRRWKIDHAEDPEGHVYHG